MSNEFRFSKVLELFGVEELPAKKLKALLFSNQFGIVEYESFVPKFLKDLGFEVPDTNQELNLEDFMRQEGSFEQELQIVDEIGEDEDQETILELNDQHLDAIGIPLGYKQQLQLEVSSTADQEAEEIL